MNTFLFIFQHFIWKLCLAAELWTSDLQLWNSQQPITNQIVVISERNIYFHSAISSTLLSFTTKHLRALSRLTTACTPRIRG